MDDGTIKHLIGHKSHSRVMETTYAHLSGEDYNQDAEIAAGFREPDEDSPLTPEVCPTCMTPLSESAKACSGCGTVFTPDAKAVEDQVENSLWDAKGEAQDDDESAAVDALRRAVRDNPDVVLQALEDAAVDEDS